MKFKPGVSIEVQQFLSRILDKPDYSIQFQYKNDEVMFGIYDKVNQTNIATCTIPMSKMPDEFQALYAKYNLIHE